MNTLNLKSPICLISSYKRHAAQRVPIVYQKFTRKNKWHGPVLIVITLKMIMTAAAENILISLVFSSPSQRLRMSYCDYLPSMTSFLKPLCQFSSNFMWRLLLTLKVPITTIVTALSSAGYFKSHFCKQCGPRSDCSLRSSLIWVHTICLYAKTGLKSLQEYSADDINRRRFQMQVFLAL